MTQDNSVNVKLSNQQLNKLKLATKNEARITLRFLSNMISNCIDKRPPMPKNTMHAEAANFLTDYY